LWTLLPEIFREARILRGSTVRPVTAEMGGSSGDNAVAAKAAVS
jgi:hypothetical protein